MHCIETTVYGQDLPAELVKAGLLELGESGLEGFVAFGGSLEQTCLLFDMGKLRLHGQTQPTSSPVIADATPDSWLVCQRNEASRGFIDAAHEREKIHGEHHAVLTPYGEQLPTLIVEGDGNVILVPECEIPPEGF